MTDIQGVEGLLIKHVIFMTGGNKGGTGKSHFCRVFLEYLFLKKWADKFTLIEADPCIGDVAEIYQQCKKIVFSENKHLLTVPDLIFEAAQEKTVVVNLPSNIKKSFDSWMVQSGMLSDLGQEYYQYIVYFFVSDGSYRSIDQFMKHMKTYQQYQKYLKNVLVLNKGRLNCGEDFWHLEEYEPLMTLIDKQKIPIIILPEFENSLQFFCDRHSYSLSEAVKNAAKFTEKQRISSYIEKIEALFDNFFGQSPDEVDLEKIVTQQGKNRKQKQLPIPREEELYAEWIA